MNLLNIIDNIEKGEYGIYYTKEQPPSISFPKNGNLECLQVEGNSFWFAHRNDIITELVKKYNSNNLFFDIGGGNGFVGKRLEKEGISVVLIEVSQSGVLSAHNKGLENIICSSFQNLKIKPNSLSAIGLFDVVEHINDDLTFLMNIYNALNKGGFVYVTVPSYSFLWSSEDEYTGHFRRYNLKEICFSLKKAGFQIEFSSYFFSILPVAIFLFRSIPNQLGFKQKNNIKQYKKEHKKRKGLINFILHKIWKWELTKIQNSEKIIFGSSCIIVAKK